MQRGDISFGSLRRRERKAGFESRKRGFICFLESWKHEIGRSFLVVGGMEHRHSAFSDVVSSFIYESNLVKWDFPIAKRKEFDSLCATLIGWKHKSTYNPGDNEKTKKEIEDLISFVEKNSI